MDLTKSNIRIYPKIEDNYVKRIDERGIKLQKSKRGAIYFCAINDITMVDVDIKLKNFFDKAKTFGLKPSYELENVKVKDEYSYSRDLLKTLKIK